MVILKRDGLFASASTVVRDRYEPVIDRIARAMNNVSGKILVVGVQRQRADPQRTLRLQL